MLFHAHFGHHLLSLSLRENRHYRACRWGITTKFIIPRSWQATLNMNEMEMYFVGKLSVGFLTRARRLKGLNGSQTSDSNLLNKHTHTQKLLTVPLLAEKTALSTQSPQSCKNWSLWGNTFCPGYNLHSHGSSQWHFLDTKPAKNTRGKWGNAKWKLLWNSYNTLQAKDMKHILCISTRVFTSQNCILKSSIPLLGWMLN